MRRRRPPCAGQGNHAECHSKEKGTRTQRADNSDEAIFIGHEREGGTERERERERNRIGTHEKVVCREWLSSH